MFSCSSRTVLPFLWPGLGTPASACRGDTGVKHLVSVRLHHPGGPAHASRPWPVGHCASCAPPWGRLCFWRAMLVPPRLPVGEWGGRGTGVGRSPLSSGTARAWEQYGDTHRQGTAWRLCQQGRQPRALGQWDSFSKTRTKTMRIQGDQNLTSLPSQ